MSCTHSWKFVRRK